MKVLKDSKHRIYVADGRPLQFHVPRFRAEPLDLLSQLPESWKGKGLEVEIGPGKGEFLARRASEHPERVFVGIDRRQDRFELTEKKLKRLDSVEESKNWIVLRADARSFLEAGLPQIEILHVYHPDPWPKARHHKNRYFRSPDAKRWAEAIRAGGALRLSTDHREYFEEIIDICHSWEFLKLSLIFKKTVETGPAFSHFESIFFKRNEPVYKAVFERI